MSTGPSPARAAEELAHLKYEEEWNEELDRRMAMPTDEDIDAETVFEELKRELSLGV